MCQRRNQNCNNSNRITSLEVLTSIPAYANIMIPSYAWSLAKAESNRERSGLIEQISKNRRCFTIIWSLDFQQRNCVSFADDFNVLLLNSFFCRGSQLNSVGFSGDLSEPAVLYFSDSEVRHWQANDTSLGATPNPPREEATAIWKEHGHIRCRFAWTIKNTHCCKGSLQRAESRWQNSLSKPSAKEK